MCVAVSVASSETKKHQQTQEHKNPPIANLKHTKSYEYRRKHLV